MTLGAIDVFGFRQVDLDIVCVDASTQAPEQEILLEAILRGAFLYSHE